MAEKNTHTLSHLDCHHHHHLEGLWVVHKLRQLFWIKYLVHEYGNTGCGVFKGGIQN